MLLSLKRRCYVSLLFGLFKLVKHAPHIVLVGSIGVDLANARHLVLVVAAHHVDVVFL